MKSSIEISFLFVMSFFNLTQLGAEDAIRASVQSAPNTSKTSDGTRTSQSSRFGDTVLPNSEANGSYEKYTAMLQKHQRSPNGKNTYITMGMLHGVWGTVSECLIMSSTVDRNTK